jgi:transcription antitermination factor NusG
MRNEFRRFPPPDFIQLIDVRDKMNTDDRPAQWYAIRVRSNFESQVSIGLRAREIEEFLPSYVVRNRWSDRVKEVSRPLFPGYLFSCFHTDTQISKIVATPGVVHVVTATKGVPAPIAQDEIDTIRQIVSSPVAIAPYPYLNTGDRIRIKRGPLAGLEGILTEFRKKYRVIVSVTILARSVAVDLESDWIEPGDSRIARPHHLAS